MTIIFAWENEAVKYGDPRYTYAVFHTNTGRLWSLEKSEEEAQMKAKNEAKGYDHKDYQFSVVKLTNGRV